VIVQPCEIADGDTEKATRGEGMNSLGEIFPGRDAVFVAEIGLNHNGDAGTALMMVDAAARAGADAVKFQTFVPSLFYSIYASSLLADGKEGAPDRSQIDFFQKLVLAPADYRRIQARAREKKLVFFSSPFDIPSVDMLESLGVPLYKIASSEVTNHILLRRVAQTGRPVVMSTGICTEEEIEAALNVLHTHGAPEVTLLHCVSLYPLPPAKANLARIRAMKTRFGVNVGFSDHDADGHTSEIAAAYGARVFEKHFMHLPGFDCPDRAVSLDPGQFARMVQGVRSVIAMEGDGHLSFDISEKEIAKSARRSLFSAVCIPGGTVITGEHLVAKRPGTGMPVYRLNDIIGRKAACDIGEDFLIRPEHLDN
jgi:N,N'-diacetyllegionaminate synthase